MEDHKINEFPRPPEASDWAQDALMPKKPPFSANRREQLLAFGLYVLAYVYLGNGGHCRCSPPDLSRRRSICSGSRSVPGKAGSGLAACCL